MTIFVHIADERDTAAMKGNAEISDGPQLVMGRTIVDGEQLTDLLAPQGLGWKARREAELALMADLVPYLQKLAGGRVISGLGAYEQ